MNQYHLVAAGDGWELVGEGGHKTLGRFSTRWQALDQCRILLEGESCLLAIHRKDGSVETVRKFVEFDDSESGGMLDYEEV